MLGKIPGASTKWLYAVNIGDERWELADTREDALAMVAELAQCEIDNDPNAPLGDQVWEVYICPAKLLQWSDLIDAHHVVDQMEERLYDEAGDPDGWRPPPLTPEAEAEWGKMLDTWATKHKQQPSWWVCVGNPESVKVTVTPEPWDPRIPFVANGTCTGRVRGEAPDFAVDLTLEGEK
jgi:hypothetical protein